MINNFRSETGLLCKMSLNLKMAYCLKQVCYVKIYFLNWFNLYNVKI